MSRLRVLIALLAFALVVAACGTSEDTTTTTSPPGQTTTTGGQETTTTAEMMEIATDVGVDLEAGVIRVGLLSDLTGVFSFLVQGIVDGYEAAVKELNEQGGINGLMIELEIFDTAYMADQTVIGFNELKDSVVAFGHSVGSPQTVAILPDLAAEGIATIPLTWYSGWTDPTYSGNLIHHGAPYCIEAMNILDFLVSEMGSDMSIAFASLGGDYGLDSMAGAKYAAEQLGLEVVLDKSGMIGQEDLVTTADAISASGADIVFITTEPNVTFPAIYQEAVLNDGMVAIWTGANPTYSPNYLLGDFAEEIERDWYGFAYVSPWGGDSQGAADVRDLMAKWRSDLGPFDYYGEGVLEVKILEEALRRAYDNGDMTRAGVLAALKSIDGLEFDGLAPPESYVGTPDEQLQRSGWIIKPSLEDLAAGGTGTTIIETDYVGPLAAAYDFQEACYQLGG